MSRLFMMRSIVLMMKDRLLFLKIGIPTTNKVLASIDSNF